MVQRPTTCDVRIAGIQDGGHNSGLVRKRVYFWLYAGYSNTILRAIFTFLRSSNTVQQVWKLSNVCVSGKSKMAAMNRK